LHPEATSTLYPPFNEKLRKLLDGKVLDSELNDKKAGGSRIQCPTKDLECGFLAAADGFARLIIRFGPEAFRFGL
jgi:hypothetical protein